MPRKPDYITPPERRRASGAIGAALRKHYPDVDRNQITQDLQSLRDRLNQLVLPVYDAEQRGVLSREERLRGMASFRPRIRSVILSLEGLWAWIWIEEHENALAKTAKDNWDDSDGPEEEFVNALIGRPSDSTLGDRLREFVTGTQSDIEQLQSSSDVHDKITFRLASRCFQKMLSELRRLQILGVCEKCGGTFFPGRRNKRFCSIDFEGKNCSGNARSQKARSKSGRHTT